MKNAQSTKSIKELMMMFNTNDESIVLTETSYSDEEGKVYWLLRFNGFSKGVDTYTNHEIHDSRRLRNGISENELVGMMINQLRKKLNIINFAHISPLDSITDYLADMLGIEIKSLNDFN